MRRGFGRTGAAVVVALLMAGGITGCGDKNRAPRDVAAPVGLPTALAAEAPADQPLTIPNPQYVRNVRALMTECVCLSY